MYNGLPERKEDLRRRTSEVDHFNSPYNYFDYSNYYINKNKNDSAKIKTET